MESASVLVFISSFAYNFVRKKTRITILGTLVTSRWIMDRLKYISNLNSIREVAEQKWCYGVGMLGRWDVGRSVNISFPEHISESTCPICA